MFNDIKKYISTAMAVAMVASSVAPVMAATTTSNEEIIGKNRTETAVKISQDGWKKAETVILVNDSAIPDALTATPLAYAKNAPILLTGKDGLSKETADEIKRLGAKDVIMIGGDAVLTSKVEEGLKALKLKVDRIKGSTREETALAIAKRLDGIKDVSEIAVVNGVTGLADAVSVAAAAAEKGMPILLANPKSGLTLVEKFIKDESIKSSFIIGGDKAVSNEIVKNLPGKQIIEGANRNETNAKVIEKFYADRELDNLYVAKDGMENFGHLIDALAVGSLAAKNGAPVLIASKKLNEKQINVINTKKISTITQVGGNGNEKAFGELKEIEKSETIKVKNEAELKEALKKANANDVIEIESSASISKDVTLSTNNAVEINVKGDLKGEVTVKAPNADIKNSGSIGTLVVENGKNTTVTNTSGGKIDKVEVSSSSENVKVENKGTITQVENNATGTTIENNGTISKPVTGTEKPSVEGNKPGGSTSGGGSSSGTVTPSIDQDKVKLIEATKKAANYEYKGSTEVDKEEKPYKYTGKIDVTTTSEIENYSSKINIIGEYGSIDLEETNNEPSKDTKKAAMDDMARYLGALYRFDGGQTIDAIEYDNNVYKWDEKGTLKGSNWKSDTIGKTLVKSIVENYRDPNNKHKAGDTIELNLVDKNNKKVTIKLTLMKEYKLEDNGKSLEDTVKEIRRSKEKSGAIVFKQGNTDISGNGIQVIDDINLIIDLNNHTYNVDGNTVGSSGTETNGFQLIKGSTVCIKNGTLKATANGTKDGILLQNYCDLTLENVDIDAGTMVSCVLSCNSGNTMLKNVDIKGSRQGLVALDVMHWPTNGYNIAPIVTINNTNSNIIDGKIDVYCEEAQHTIGEKSKLIINGGTFTGKLNDNPYVKGNIEINGGTFN